MIRAAAVILSPFSLVVMLQLLAIVIGYQARTAPFEDELAAGKLRGPPPAPRRAVWIVFDSLDQRVAFDERPPGVVLPALDRLANESLVATHAYPPASATVRSMPALTTGLDVIGATAEGTSDLLLEISGGEVGVREQLWSSVGTVFARLRGVGFDSALAGWAHPYCRVIAGELSACQWAGHRSHERNKSFEAALQEQLSRLFFSLPLTFRFWGVPLEQQWRGSHLAQFRSIHGAARSYVADPDMEFVFLHYPLPHLPGIFDAGAGELSVTGPTGYLANLQLMDRIIAEL